MKRCFKLLLFFHIALALLKEQYTNTREAGLTQRVVEQVFESRRVPPSRRCRLHSRLSGCTARRSRCSSRWHSGTWTASHR